MENVFLNTGFLDQNDLRPENAYELVLAWGVILDSKTVAKLRKHSYAKHDRPAFLEEVNSLGLEKISQMGLSEEDFLKLKVKRGGGKYRHNIHHQFLLFWGARKPYELVIMLTKEHERLHDALDNINFYYEDRRPEVGEYHLFAYLKTNYPILLLGGKDLNQAVRSASQTFLRNPPLIPALPDWFPSELMDHADHAVKKIQRNVGILLERDAFFEKSSFRRKEENTRQLLREARRLARDDRRKDQSPILSLQDFMRDHEILDDLLLMNICSPEERRLLREITETNGKKFPPVFGEHEEINGVMKMRDQLPSHQLSTKKRKEKL